MLSKLLLFIGFFVHTVKCASLESDNRRSSHVTWYAPFQSGGGYCSEATSFVHALNAVDFKNFSISQHGDSYNYKYIQGMMESEKELLGSLDISQYSRRFNENESKGQRKLRINICHSEPGAWSAPTPKYHTVACPPPAASPTNKKRFSSEAANEENVIFNIGRTMFETDRIPDGWVHRLNFMDEIWVPTEFSREIFLQAGVHADKLVVLGETVDTDFFKPMFPSATLAVSKAKQNRTEAKIVRRRAMMSMLTNTTSVTTSTAGFLTELGKSIGIIHSAHDSDSTVMNKQDVNSINGVTTVFLFVGKFEERKGFGTLLRAYFSSFSAQDDVVLLILTSAYHSSSELEKEVQKVIKKEKLDLIQYGGSSTSSGSSNSDEIKDDGNNPNMAKLPPKYVVLSDVSQEHMPYLYSLASALVSCLCPF